MALPYDVVKVIEEAVPDPERAEKVIRAIEEGLGAVREEARAQKEVIKAELKEELAKEVASKADIARIEEAISHLATKEELARLEARLEARFAQTEVRLGRLEIWLKILAAIMLAGFTIFNPGFHQVLKAIIAYIGA